MAGAPKWNPETCLLRGQILSNIEKGDRERREDIQRLFKLSSEQGASILRALELSTTFDGRMKSVEEGVQTILNVRANGSIGLEAVLRELMEATKGVRIRRRILADVFDWFENHKTMKAVLRWFIPKAIVFSLALLVFSYLQEHGIDVDFLKLFQAVRP
jgi:hypothetical protein